MRWMNASTHDVTPVGPQGTQVPPSSVVFFTDIYCGGTRVDWGQPPQSDLPAGGLPSGVRDKVSSVVIAGPTKFWVVFWETLDNPNDDSLWIPPIPAEWAYLLPDLNDRLNVTRPHGNNNWGDLIDGISWRLNPPTGNHENRTIHWGDGYQIGTGHLSSGGGIGGTPLRSDGTLIKKG
jgi:hypothetical protein